MLCTPPSFCLSKWGAPSSWYRWANDVIAAPEGFGFAVLAGECPRSRSVAMALDVDVPMISLPHLKNLVLQLLLGSACEASVSQRLLMSMCQWPHCRTWRIWFCNSCWGVDANQEYCKCSWYRCANDLSAAPEEFGFAALAGECLWSTSLTKALNVDVPMISLPHLKNFVLHLLGSACKGGVLQGLLMSMS